MALGPRGAADMKLAYRHVILLFPFLSRFCYTEGNSEVKTSVGDDVVLPCRVDPAMKPSVNRSEMTIEWSRTDLPSTQYVHLQRNGNETLQGKSPSYQGRTSLFLDEVKKGNVSLKLSRVKSSDEGNYTCVIPEIPEVKKFTVRLMFEVSTTSSPSSSSVSWFIRDEQFRTLFTVSTLLIFQLVMMRTGL